MKLAQRLRAPRFRRKGSLTLLAALLSLAAMLAFQQPMEAYAITNPGLDSGNAVVATVGSDTVLSYKTVGNSTFKAPAGVTSVRVLVVGGGGGGGAGELNSSGDGGGGGGAGEYVHQTSFAVTPGAPLTVTVGANGNGSTTKQNDGGTTAQNGTSGSNSVFSSLTGRGGGGGGGNDQHGVNGGSGGGAGGHCTSGSTNGGTKTAVSPGVGNNGGNSPSGSCTPRGAAGGGGAGAVGTNGSSGNGGAGAIGLQNDITGTNSFYAAGGGGGGGSGSGSGASGGSSIGGNGGSAAATGGSGTVGAANTGSGGGGGGASTSTSGGNGGNGGSGVVIVRFTTQNITPPSPGGVSGLAMWYKADSAGNTVAQWNDSSGLGYHLTQPDATKQPTFNSGAAINFNPAYNFAGTDGTKPVLRWSGHGIGASDSMTAFYAGVNNTAAGGDRYFSEFGDDRPSISSYNGQPRLYVLNTSPVDTKYSTTAVSSPLIYSFVSPNGGGTKVIGVNGKEESTAVTGSYTTNGSATGATFGNRNDSSGIAWMGSFGESLFFNKALTAQERQRINSYLAIKWGTTLDQGTSGTAYLDSAGASVWPADATYKNEIGGIGRDDASTLNQKQSKVGDLPTIGHGTIAATNQANTNSFGADKSFLLWGHNGAATNTTTTVTGAYVRMDRIWKTVRTTTVGTPLKVRIPKTAAPGANGVMYVSASPTFDASSQRISMADLGSEYEATVTSWPAATSYFSFGSLTGADIQFVSKTATNTGGDPITDYTPGESMSYVLKVKNNGPENAGTVTVSDTLPTGLVPVSGTGGGWGCIIAGQTVTCTRTALNNGITAPDLIIEATIASSVTGSKPNTATASVANDPDTSNNSASLTLPAAPKADLSITKAHSGVPAAGGTLTYNFTVTNDGPSDVASFTVTDNLNSNLSFASATGISCIGTTSLTCTGGAIPGSGTPAARTKTFSITVNVSPSYPGGDIPNTGTVAVPSGTTDPTSGNNSSTDNTTVLVSTDIGITKTHTGNFTAGVNNNFTITVDNQGPSNAPTGSVTVSDTLDDDFSYVSATGTNWSCTHSNGTVTCTNTAVITAGGNAPIITLTVLVDPIAKATTTNIADVSSTTPDPDLNDNSSTDNVTIQSSADLGITKAHVGTAFTAGTQEQYIFTVVNNGPSADSPSYTITDTLPAGVTFVSAEPGSAASCIGTTTVTCTGGAIGAGDPAQVTTINVAVGGSVTGTLNNSATVAPAAGTTDPTPGNDTGNDSVNVEPNADLSITKTPTTDMTAGANATYTVRVDNAGPSNVSGYTVTDTLDPNLTYVSSTPNICTPTGTSPAGGQILTCTDTTGILSGSNSSFTITATVNKSATPGSTITNPVSVAPPTGVNDPVTSNNSTSVNRNVVASADLQITKTHTGNFTAGTNNNTFTIVVTNAGPSDATTFTVTDILPSGLTYVNADGTAGVGVDCIPSGQTVTCTGGPAIGAGETSTITLTVAVAASTPGNTVYNNTASVTSATPDPNNANNTSPADAVTVDSKADLEISKTNMTDFTAGSDEDYNIQVINNGPSDVTGFTVSDTMPAGLTFVQAGSDPSCSPGTPVTCTGGPLASGASTNITIRVHTDPGLTTGTVINNTASVATIAPTTDPVSGNNSSTDPTTIVTVTDLSIQKNPVGPYTAGDTGQFTFTVNNAGPSATPAGDVQVTDSLPGGMTFASGSGTNWDCTGSAGQSVVCTYTPSLAVSATTPLLTVTVNIASDMQGQVQNTGSVLSTFDDSDPADDTSTITVTVGAEADLTATKVRQGSGDLVAGQPVTYRFEVTNNGGPSQANNVTITDNLQGDFTFQSFASVSGGTWDCSDTSGTVTCTLPSLGVNETAIVDVTLKIAEDAPNPLVNAATVTFNGTDPTPANPSSSDPLTYSADLEVDITHEQKAYHAGDTVDYTLTVTNHGPSAAEDTVLTVTIPEGLTVEHVSATAPGGDSILAAVDRLLFPPVSAASNPFTCSLNGNKLVCTASTLFVGVYNLFLTAKINTGFTGQIVLAAQITSSTPDPNPNDTTATDILLDVLPATGQNIWLWAGGALALITAAVTVFLRIRRNQYHSSF